MTDRITSYQQAIDWIFGLINYERKPGRSRDFRLDRTHALLEAVGNPHESIPVVHIAGTKGKGSTATMLAAMLQGSGFTTGLFTSPHITRFEERFTVNGEQATESEIVALTQQLMEAAERSRVMPTYFEAAMVLAWCFYRDRKADIAVLEVGLGGRLDATNVCRPEVCVITSISYDHMNVLGNTLDKIAGEKAGIIKPGIPVVSGVGNEPARGVIRDRAKANGSVCYEIRESIHFEYHTPESPLDVVSIDLQTPFTRWPELTVNLRGEHQAENLALAATAFDVLADRGWNVDRDRSRSGLANLVLPGRIEVVGRDPSIVLDGAHNTASVSRFVQWLEVSRMLNHEIAIFAASANKNHNDMLARILPAFDHVVLTQYLKNPRAVHRETLREGAEKLVIDETYERPTTIHVADSPASALEQARNLQDASHGIICVTGSFFIVSEIRELLV